MRLGDIIRCKRCGACVEIVDAPTTNILIAVPVRKQLADRTIDHCPECLIDHAVGQHLHNQAVADGTAGN